MEKFLPVLEINPFAVCVKNEAEAVNHMHRKMSFISYYFAKTTI